MLRLAPVAVETPKSVDEALRTLALYGDRAKVVAGGTDVMPNLKHELLAPDVLIHIGRIKDLAGVQEQGDALIIGARTTLHDIATHALVLRHVPGLAAAAAEVASPQLRRMGTLGGNLALDTRCLYFNQSYFWRESLGFCLKKDGSVCHVVAGGKKCVAAASNDTATMLLCLGASVELRSAAGTRTVPLEEFYVADGIKNTVLRAEELMVSVRVPKAAPRTRHGYAKLRHRAAIDFPLLSVAARVDFSPSEGQPNALRIDAAQLVVSALQARPLRVALDPFVGRTLDDATIDDIATLAHQRANPMTNIADDPQWRKAMVPVLVKRALRLALQSASGAPSGPPAGAAG